MPPRSRERATAATYAGIGAPIQSRLDAPSTLHRGAGGVNKLYLQILMGLHPRPTCIERNFP
jgi:hypothetical protein